MTKFNIPSFHNNFGAEVVAFHSTYNSSLYLTNNEFLHGFDPFSDDLDEDSLKEMYRKICHGMNLAWSSSCGVACFPEDYSNKKQKIVLNGESINFIGTGWMVIFYKNGRSSHGKAISDIMKSPNREELFLEHARKMVTIPVEEG